MRHLALTWISWKQARPGEPSQPCNAEGQTVVEYALVVGLVSIVIILALGVLGEGIVTKLATKVNTFLP